MFMNMFWTATIVFNAATISFQDALVHKIVLPPCFKCYQKETISSSAKQRIMNSGMFLIIMLRIALILYLGIFCLLDA